jgi:hypothetical protein
MEMSLATTREKSERVARIGLVVALDPVAHRPRDSASTA